MANGISSDKFIDVLQDLHSKIDDLKTGLYIRIDDINHQSADRLKNCNERFTIIEKTTAARNGANAVEKKISREQRDFWKYIVRGLLLAMSISMMGIVWKLFVTIPIPK